MKTRFLFPHKWRIAGIVLSLIAIALAIYNNITSGGLAAETNLYGGFFGKPFKQQFNVVLNDVEYLFIIMGLLLVAFSKEKIEDEQIAQLRLDSLQWAVYVNYGILIICIVCINGVDFLTVFAYNVISQLVFLIIRFRWKVYQLNRMMNKEEGTELKTRLI